MKWAIVVACAWSARTAAAAPSGANARAAFDKGVAAYKAGNFTAASDALEKSFKLEADPDTLFAWAQSERKVGHCDKAIPLYERLLKFDMPAENKAAIASNLAECKALVPTKQDAPTETKRPVQTKASTSVEAKASASLETPADVDRTPTPPPVESRPWWKDPVGDGLVVVGVVGLGVGAGMLISAQSLSSKANNTDQTTNYFAFQSLRDQANSRSKLGIISGGVGAALAVGGIVWYATHRSERQVVGWLDAGGGGLGVAGAW